MILYICTKIEEEELNLEKYIMNLISISAADNITHCPFPSLFVHEFFQDISNEGFVLKLFSKLSLIDFKTHL